MSLRMRVLVLVLCVSLTWATRHGLQGLRHLVPTTSMQSSTRTHRTASDSPCRLDLCLALDSSFGRSFYAERRVARRLAGSLLKNEKDIRIGAVQFGSISKLLSPLTTDLRLFEKNLHDTANLGKERNSNGGFLGCRFVLHNGVDKTRAHAQKAIVIIVGGDATVGGSLERDVSSFRAQGGSVLIVVNGKAQGDWLHRLSAGKDSVLVVPELWRSEETASTCHKLEHKLCSRTWSPCMP